MADTREMRIFSAEQIQVPQNLPTILKEYSKEVILKNPQDIIAFSKEYFETKMKEHEGGGANKWQSLSYSISNL